MHLLMTYACHRKHDVCGTDSHEAHLQENLRDLADRLERQAVNDKHRLVRKHLADRPFPWPK